MTPNLRKALSLLLPNVLAAIAAIYLFQGYVYFTDDRRSALDIFDDIKARGGDPALAFFPGKLLPLWEGADLKIDDQPVLPLSGISRRETVYCREVGRDGNDFIVYTSDEYGFRNPAGLWGRGPIDLMVLGDSFTQGACVNKDYPSYLRATFATTLSLGMRNNGSLLNLAALSEYGPMVKPKRVVWGFYENDLVDYDEESRHALLRRYLEPGFRQGLAERRDGIDAMLDRLQQKIVDDRNGDQYWSRQNFSVRHYDGVVDFLLLRSLRSRLNLSLGQQERTVKPRDTASDIAGVVGALQTARSVVRDWDGELFFVWLPSAVEFSLRAPGAKEKREQIVAAVKALGIPVIDLSDLFEGHPAAETLFQCKGCHYTEEGYRLVGTELAKRLAQPN